MYILFCAHFSAIKFYGLLDYEVFSLFFNLSKNPFLRAFMKIALFGESEIKAVANLLVKLIAT
jgi:hypothetical protein